MNFKKLLKNEFDKIVPEQSERLKSTAIVSLEQEKPKNKFSFYKLAISLSCVFVFAFISIFAVFFNFNTTPPKSDYSSYITLNINPSFSLVTDKDGKVENVVAENYDGEIVLSGLLFDGEKYDEAIEKIVSECKKLGFISTSDGISVGVNCKSDKIYQKIQTAITSIVETAVNGEKSFTIEKKDNSYIKDVASEYVDYITSQSSFNEIISALKNKKGYFGERREQDVDGEQTTDLTLLKVVLECAEEQAECFEELDEIMSEQGFASVSAMVAYIYQNPFASYSEKAYKALGELAEITFGVEDVFSVVLRYEDIKEKYSFNLTEDEIEEKIDEIDECLDEFDQNAYNEIKRFLSSDEKLNAVFTEVKDLLYKELTWADIFKTERTYKLFRLERSLFS